MKHKADREPEENTASGKGKSPHPLKKERRKYEYPMPPHDWCSTCEVNERVNRLIIKILEKF